MRAADQAVLHEHRLVTLMQLARRARRARTAEALGFVAVNESRELFDYRQSALWIAGRGVVAVSGLPAPVPGAPYTQWLDKAMRHLHRAGAASRAVDASALPASLAPDWAEWLPACGALVALPDGDGAVLGYWLMARDQQWRDAELELAGEVAEAYAHAWSALAARRLWWQPKARHKGSRYVRFAVLAVLAALSMVPVRLSVLAPAEVVAQDPFLVRAPFEGVVDAFRVRPNSPVKAGQELFELDTPNVRTRYSIAGKAYAAAAEEYRQAAQLAVNEDERARLDMVVRRGKMEEKAAELAYNRQLLERIQVRAPRDGVAVFADASDWIGKHVAIGERVMQIADPSRIEIAIRLPVSDAIALAPDAEVTLYLTTAPEYSYSARVTYAAYRAEVQPDGVLAYKMKAQFTPGQTPPRLGLTGTAKIYGGTVPLAYYVLRRPFSAARQWLGW